jgi:hypothetical protein
MKERTDLGLKERKLQETMWVSGAHNTTVLILC